MDRQKPASGKILISDPFLQDPNFARTLVLLAEHNDMGTFGFVLNNAIDLTLDVALQNDSLPKTPICQGGPVELTSLHFLHTLGNVIANSKEIIPGIYWGGDFTKALELLENKPTMEEQFIFFLGYSGWAQGQLQDELEEEAWIVGEIGSSILFKRELNAHDIWKMAMKNLGGKYALLVDSPIDPSLN